MMDLGINHAITSKIEHHAVGHTLEDMASKGMIKLSYVNLDNKGSVDLNHLEQLLSSNDRSFVSLMHANNEIGNLLPLKECGEICKEYKAIFHSDTVQTMAHYRFDLQDLYIHFVTGSAHKFHGPKGNGFLYVNEEVSIKPNKWRSSRKEYESGTKCLWNSRAFKSNGYFVRRTGRT